MQILPTIIPIFELFSPFLFESYIHPSVACNISYSISSAFLYMCYCADTWHSYITFSAAIVSIAGENVQAVFYVLTNDIVNSSKRSISFLIENIICLRYFLLSILIIHYLSKIYFQSTLKSLIQMNLIKYIWILKCT